MSARAGRMIRILTPSGVEQVAPEDLYTWRRT